VKLQLHLAAAVLPWAKSAQNDSTRSVCASEAERSGLLMSNSASLVHPRILQLAYVLGVADRGGG
jgi:hypothetical protein